MSMFRRRNMFGFYEDDPKKVKIKQFLRWFFLYSPLHTYHFWKSFLCYQYYRLRGINGIGRTVEIMRKIEREFLYTDDIGCGGFTWGNSLIRIFSDAEMIRYPFYSAIALIEHEVLHQVIKQRIENIDHRTFDNIHKLALNYDLEKHAVVVPKIKGKGWEYLHAV